MNNITLSDSALRVENNAVYADSRDIAVHFGKEHKHVLRDIRHAQDQITQVLQGGPNLDGPEFTEVTEWSEAANKNVPVILLNRDAFAFVVMGYTGAKATEFKLAYIARFNAMEAALRAAPQLPPPASITKLIHPPSGAALREVNRMVDRVLGVANDLTAAGSYAVMGSVINGAMGVEIVPPQRVETKFLSATEVGAIVSKSANAVGRMASKLGLKRAGVSECLRTVAPNGRTVETWRYGPEAVAKLVEALA